MIKSSLFMTIPLLLQLFKHALFLLLPMLVSACLPMDVTTGKAKTQLDLSEQLVTAAALSDDGRFSLIADGQQVCLWNNDTATLRYPCLSGQEAEQIDIVGITSDNRYFYTSNRLSVSLYDLKSGRLSGRWSDGQNIINDIAIANDGAVLLLGYRSGQAAVIETKTQQFNLYGIHALDINSVALSGDGSLALTGSSDKTAVLWDPLSSKEVHRFTHPSRVNYVALSSDGDTGFTIDAINSRQFFNARNGEPGAQLDSYVQFMEFNDAGFSERAEFFVTGSPRQQIRLWRTRDGSLIGQWQSHKVEGRDRASVLSVAFSGNEIVTLTNDGMLETWSTGL